MNLPEQSSKQLTKAFLLQQKPWTEEEYERVRQAALTLRATHASWHLPNGEIRPSFDGHVYWQLLGALDRTNNHALAD